METALRAKRRPVEAAIEPVAPPPTEANLGMKVTVRAATGWTKRIMGADEVFQTVEAAKLAP